MVRAGTERRIRFGAHTSIAISKVPGARHRSDDGAFPMDIQASRCSISAESEKRMLGSALLSPPSYSIILTKPPATSLFGRS
jgi:hypothetical protein